MTIEIIISIIALLVFSLLLLLAGLRLRSRQAAIPHLALYAGLGFLTNLSALMAMMNFAPQFDFPYLQTATLMLLGMISTFGALSLSFVERKQTLIAGYWAGAVAALTLWSIATFNIGGWGQRLAELTGGEPAFILAAVSWGGAMLTAFSTIWLQYRQAKTAKYQNRLRYWLIATALLTVSGLLFLFSPALFPQAGLILLLGGSLMAGYVTLTYQHPDLNRLIGRALHYLGVSGLLAVVFYLALAFTIVVDRSSTATLNVFFWAIIMAILLAIITRFLWRLADRFFIRVIFGARHHDEKKVFQYFNRRLISALDMKRLGDTIISLMVETLEVKQAIVFINESHKEGYLTLRPLSAVGGEAPASGQFKANSAFVNHFRKGQRYVHQYDIDVLPEFETLAPAERDWLSDLKMELYVPILRQRQLVGLLALGARRQGMGYYQEDIELLVYLAEQAALAMDSARLFDQLATINREMGSLNERIEGMDQSKSDFLSIASHELRTPLTHIHGYSRMLLELTDEELQNPAYFKPMIEGVAKGSERMKNVIDLMLGVTEVHIGEMNLFTGPVDLQEVVERANRPFLTALDQRRIAFGTSGFENIPLIQGDGARLGQALENLLSNAIKYTPDGGLVKIEGRTITLNETGPAVEIAIIDNGIGIDPEYHERIFEKFFRIDDSDHHSTGKTKFKGAGPGLGLTLVKGIVEAHGGRVHVESLGHDEINRPGSRFIVVLPYKPTPKSKSKKDDKARPRQSKIETVHWRAVDAKPPGPKKDSGR